MALKYKVGNKVRIKSFDWYNENKTRHGDVWFDNAVFVGGQSLYCGCELTIRLVTNDSYYVIENDYYWTDEMIEGLVEEETKKEDIAWMYDGKLVAEKISGNMTIIEPKYNKLTINTEFCDDKVELAISPDFELKQEGDKWFAVKKKKEYPKTYEECAKIMNCPIAGPSGWLFNFDANIKDPYYRKIDILMGKFTRLLICRDAYWKIAGEEMGLGKPWKPDWTANDVKHSLVNVGNTMIPSVDSKVCRILTFPTKEIRDIFKENFKELIEQCKELL